MRKVRLLKGQRSSVVITRRDSETYRVDTSHRTLAAIYFGRTNASKRSGWERGDGDISSLILGLAVGGTTVQILHPITVITKRVTVPCEQFIRWPSATT